jgi:predicted DNA-binding transcriptional regulator YafY
MFGSRIAIAIADVADVADRDRVELEIRDASAYLIAVQLAGFGDRVEVTEPEEVRAELARIGGELSGRYTTHPVR